MAQEFKQETNEPVQGVQNPIKDEQIEAIQFIPKGINWSHASTNSVDPGHKHTDGAISSESATDGQVLTADGAGGAAFEDPPGIVGTFVAYEALTAGDAVCLVSPDAVDQSYSEANQDTDQAIGDDAARTYIAQGFLAGATTYINKIDLYLKKTGSPSGDLTVHIYSNVGSEPGSSLGSGTILGTAITTSYAYVSVTFDDPISLISGTAYHIVITRTAAVNASNYFILGYNEVGALETGYPASADTNTIYAIREGNATPAWSLTGSATKYRDAIFKTYKEDVTATAQVRKTKATSVLRTYNFIGFAASSVSAGASVTVNRYPTVTGLSSITPGRPVYLSDTAGGLSASPGSLSFQVAVGKTTTAIEITPPVPTGVPGWVDLGSKSWSASSATQTFTISPLYDLLLLVYWSDGSGGPTVTLRLNGITAANYEYRYFDTGNAFATASSQTSFQLGIIGSDRQAVAQFLISGKRYSSKKTITAVGNGLGADGQNNALIDGILSSNDADTSSISILFSGACTGKARLYGLIL